MVENVGKNSREQIYLNPVYPHSFPDPFVLKYCGEYWGYCTGIQSDNRCFGLLHSTDLINWEFLGGAMEQLPEKPPFYWAPEVVYSKGLFYLYYSVGDEVNMQMRVAVSSDPAGPFKDSGHGLTKEKFAIDGHVLVDDDGKNYLFYATDFLDHDFIGTGTVRDLMLDPFTLSGNPRPVTRPRFDWHVYDPHRLEKGGVRWHTIEGSFVLKRKNLYYQMFSGGNWQNPSYGVSYAVSDSVTRMEEWTQIADGKKVLPILRSITGKVIGPGHNSVVRGPDNQQLFCVYHRWTDDLSERVMAIDPLDWAGERMLILGPSTTPQPAIIMPHVIGFDNKNAKSKSNWEYTNGAWSEIGNNNLSQNSQSGFCQALCATTVSCLVTEASIKAGDGTGTYGICLNDTKGNELLRFELLPHIGQAIIAQNLESEADSHSIMLPEDFNFKAFHLLRLEWDGFLLKAELDKNAARWEIPFKFPELQVSLFTQDFTATFAGFGLTVAWKDLFEPTISDIASTGWSIWGDNLKTEVVNRELLLSDKTNQSVVSKGPLFENYLAVINVRLQEIFEKDGCYGFYPAFLDINKPGFLVCVAQQMNGWALNVKGASENYTFSLPEYFDPSVYQQFRFRKQQDFLTFYWENNEIGQIQNTSGASYFALYINKATVGVDEVRLTET